MEREGRAGVGGGFGWLASGGEGLASEIRKKTKVFQHKKKTM